MSLISVSFCTRSPALVSDAGKLSVSRNNTLDLN